MKEVKWHWAKSNYYIRFMDEDLQFILSIATSSKSEYQGLYYKREKMIVIGVDIP